jgi:hypothetical protein
VKNISFGLLELEMADLERFWRKTPLGPLGVKGKVTKKISKPHNLCLPYPNNTYFSMIKSS